MKGLGYPLYVNGKLFDEPVTISHVPANAQNGMGASDRDPSMGGLGRLSGLGQYVSYYPNFPSMGATDVIVDVPPPPPGTPSPLTITIMSVIGSLGIYHGYKRNDSVGWALGWGVLTAAFPIIMLPIALAQGFGKPKVMHANAARKRKRGSKKKTRRSSSKKIYVLKPMRRPRRFKRLRDAITACNKKRRAGKTCWVIEQDGAIHTRIH